MAKSSGGAGRLGRAKVQTFEQFAAQRNAGRFGADVATNRLPNTSTGQRRRIQQRQLNEVQANAARRTAARSDFDRAVSSGQIRPPTRTEILIRNAQGHPDNPSTQAARRLLAKQGITV